MAERLSDFKMPEKVVARLLKDALPDNVVVSKDAKKAACNSASIFILQLSIAAAERAQAANRRHLENQDIIKAVTELGLEEYAPQLVRFGAQRKRNAKRRESNVLKSKAGRNAARGIDNEDHQLDAHDQNDTQDQQETSEPSFDQEGDSQELTSQDEDELQIDE